MQAVPYKVIEKWVEVAKEDGNYMTAKFIKGMLAEYKLAKMNHKTKE